MRLYRAGRIDGLDAITSQDVSDFKCESCIMGKGTRLPSPPAEDIRATKPGELIHIDLRGPAAVTSIGGARNFLTCYDDYSCKVHLSFLKQKSDAFTLSSHTLRLLKDNSVPRSRPSAATMGENSHQRNGTTTCVNSESSTSEFLLTLMLRTDGLNAFT
jgi:hypothetical protein